MILGVASIWDHRKGLQDLLNLYKLLDENYRIVIVGVSKFQLKTLPEGVIGIMHTNNIDELRQYYALADYFVNPTYEDNYPTTNLEAIACGTTTLTYSTGGSVESVSPSCVVTKGDVIALYHLITSGIISNDRIIDYNKETMLDNYNSIICKG